MMDPSNPIRLSKCETITTSNTNDFNQLDAICRLCMGPDQDVILFSTYKNQTTYLDVAKLLTDIEINENDKLPKGICIECASNLILFHKFKKICELSCVTLTKTLSTINRMDPKVEQPNDIVDDDCMEYEQKVSLNHGVESETEHLFHSNSDSEQIEIVTESIKTEEIPSEMITNTEEFHYFEMIKNDDELVCEENIEIITSTDSVEIPDNVPATILAESESVAAVLQFSSYKCPDCDVMFTRKSTMNQHRLTHSGLKSFVCSVCANRFTRKAHLEIHMRIHYNVKPYTCEKCTRSFTKSSDLTRHRRIHTGERNYSCTECDKRFRRSNDVIAHMRVHTGARPYRCPVCIKCYSSHSSLKKHMLTHKNK